jgi:Flp pilus assembly protein TadD
VFLLLLAPTSSFVPIADPYAERRLYLPFIGLLLIAAEFVRRVRAKRSTIVAVLGIVLAFEAVLTYQRNVLWGDAIALWKTTAEASPTKQRPAFQYAQALVEANREGDAIPVFARAVTLDKPNFGLLVDWGLAYDHMGNHAKALEKLHEAALVETNSIVYTQIAMVQAEQEDYTAALQSLQMAETLDAGNATVFKYRGNIFLTQGNTEGARQQFRRAVELDPRDEYSRQKLAALGG